MTCALTPEVATPCTVLPGICIPVCCTSPQPTWHSPRCRTFFVLRIHDAVSQVHPTGLFETLQPHDREEVSAAEEAEAAESASATTNSNATLSDGAQDGLLELCLDRALQQDHAEAENRSAVRRLSRSATRNFNRSGGGGRSSQIGEHPKSLASRFFKISWDVVLPQTGVVQRFKVLPLDHLFCSSACS